MNKLHKINISGLRPANGVECVDFIIATALKLGASDIHLGINSAAGSTQNPFLLRFRVEGKLQVVNSNFVTAHYKEVIGRLKILADMSSTDVGIPLDGQVKVEAGQEHLVLRISTVPAGAFDEVVIRIQRENTNYSFDNLQVTSAMRVRLDNLIHQKSGMIILNGPAGSGKTTTIYSIITALASPQKKVLTAEDPIEARLPYVSHMQVTAKSDFATLGRAFMRQDADVIFVGEIRDEISAATTAQLAQTGHLVLTTLHSRNSLGVISRLESFNIHSNTIASCLIGSLSQRLVPALCSQCREPMTLEQNEQVKLHYILPIPPDAQLFRPGPGCQNCTFGYSGRLPIYELFVVDGELANAIDSRKSTLEILAMARRKGMNTLAEEALVRVYAGLTDLESVRSHVFGPAY